MPIDKLILAGAAAEGHGAIAGWRGSGHLTRSEILEIIRASEVTGILAPKQKSAVAYMGAVVAQLNSEGYIVRRARAVQKDSTGCRAYKVRWVVALSAAATADVGDSAGTVKLVIDITDTDLEPQYEGDPDIANEVQTKYQQRAGGEIYTAGEITTWLQSTLIERFAACQLGALGLYIPATHRADAQKFLECMSIWGVGWILPLLPVATGPELTLGVFRSLESEVEALETEWRTAQYNALESERAVQPRTAARLLVACTDLRGRLEPYLALLGPAMMRLITGRLSELESNLGDHCTGAQQRVALITADLEFPPPAEPEVVEADPDGAERFSLLDLD